MNQQIQQEAAEWLVELQDRPDAATRQRFDQWLATSPEHVRAYLECTAIAETARHAARAAPQDVEALIERARRASDANVIALAPAARDADEVASAQRDAFAERSWLMRTPRYVRFAAAAVLLAVIGAGVGYVTTRNVYATAVGEQRSILLVDGSTIDMNGHSKVRVRLGSRSRAVDLMEGEALFRVAKDKARPFIVSANQTRVRAVGTEFAVNRRQHELIVTVVDGTVAVSAPMASSRSTARGAGGSADAGPAAANSVEAALAVTSDEILVDAGQQLALSLAVPGAGSALPRPRAVNVNDAIAWTRRRLVFDSTPLEDVVAEFNRNSNRALVIRSDGLEDFHVSGAFSSTDVGPFLRFLRAQPGVEVVEEQDRILIRHR